MHVEVLLGYEFETEEGWLGEGWGRDKAVCMLIFCGGYEFETEAGWLGR